MDVVVHVGDGVAGAGEVVDPVVVSVAGGGVVALAIELGVGDGHLAGGRGAENKVLAADLGGLESRLLVDCNFRFQKSEHLR